MLFSVSSTLKSWSVNSELNVFQNKKSLGKISIKWLYDLYETNVSKTLESFL